MQGEIRSETQHYVPKCYLRNFISGGKVWAYQRDKKPFQTSIENVAAQNNYYMFEDKDSGEKTNAVEKMFVILESAACPILENIIKRENLEIDERQRGAIAQFISFLTTRGPSFEEWQKNMTIEFRKNWAKALAVDKKIMEKRFRRAGIEFKTQQELEEMRDSLMNFDDHFTVEIKGGRGHFFKIAAEIAMDLTEILYFKEWHLLRIIGSREFVTSDNPVTIQQSRTAPPLLASGFQYGVVLLPISPRLCLLIRNLPYKNRVISLNREQIDYINRSIMRRSGRFVYASLKSLDIENEYRKTPFDLDKKVYSRRIGRTPYVETFSFNPDLEILIKE